MIDSDKEEIEQLVNWVQDLTCYKVEEDAEIVTIRNRVIRHLLGMIHNRLGKGK